jgi:hypothetical protein
MSFASTSTSATHLHATLRIEQAPVGGHLAVQDAVASEHVSASTRPTLNANTPTRVSPSGHSVSHPYNDPCNYLG